MSLCIPLAFPFAPPSLSQSQTDTPIPFSSHFSSFPGLWSVVPVSSPCRSLLPHQFVPASAKGCSSSVVTTLGKVVSKSAHNSSVQLIYPSISYCTSCWPVLHSAARRKLSLFLDRTHRRYTVELTNLSSVRTSTFDLDFLIYDFSEQICSSPLWSQQSAKLFASLQTRFTSSIYSIGLRSRQSIRSPNSSRAPAIMGGQFSKMRFRLFGNKEMRILMLGLDAAGKTSMLLFSPPPSPPSINHG
jgi:ADP-ribosylation factor family